VSLPVLQRSRAGQQPAGKYGGVYALSKRRAEVAKKEAPAKPDHHVEFAPVPAAKLWTPANLFLAALMALGLAGIVASAIPASRAASVHPMVALRAE